MVRACPQGGWIGERYDADASLQYLNARYYDPELSLFLQPDWFEVTKAGVGTNRFSYSFNDPVNKLDPGGNLALLAIPAWEGAKWAAITVGTAVVGYMAVETIDGTIVSTPIENLDLPQEGFSEDPDAGKPLVLANPVLEGYQGNIEGVTATSVPGSNVLPTPATESEIRDNIVTASALRHALGLSVGHSGLAHHNIPRQHKDLPAVKAAIRAGYEFEGAMNGTRVVGQAGGHPRYNDRIGRELEDLWKLGQAEGWTDAEYRRRVQEISDRERETIEDDGDYVHNK